MAFSVGLRRSRATPRRGQARGPLLPRPGQPLSQFKSATAAIATFAPSRRSASPPRQSAGWFRPDPSSARQLHWSPAGPLPARRAPAIPKASHWPASDQGPARRQQPPRCPDPSPGATATWRRRASAARRAPATRRQATGPLPTGAQPVGYRHLAGPLPAPAPSGDHPLRAVAALIRLSLSRPRRFAHPATAPAPPTARVPPRRPSSQPPPAHLKNAPATPGTAPAAARGRRRGRVRRAPAPTCARSG